jgi:hypothetical protein
MRRDLLRPKCGFKIDGSGWVAPADREPPSLSYGLVVDALGFVCLLPEDALWFRVLSTSINGSNVVYCVQRL